MPLSHSHCTTGPGSECAVSMCLSRPSLCSFLTCAELGQPTSMRFTRGLSCLWTFTWVWPVGGSDYRSKEEKWSQDFYTPFSLSQIALVSCSPLLKATAPVGPSFLDSSSLVALSFCPGDSPVGSTSSLQLLAPPYIEPFPLILLTPL